MSFKVDALSPAQRYFLSLFPPDHIQLLSDLEVRLGYYFQNPGYLCEAITHRSAIHDRTPTSSNTAISSELIDLISHNEKLEFLGDSLLSLAISTWLWHHRKQQSEGEFSRMRAFLVQESTLADIARQYHLGACLLMGRGAHGHGGREQNAILADSLEALLGAIYLDGGFQAAAKVVEKIFTPHLHENTPEEMLLFDHKTRLQELTQKHFAAVPTYHVLKEEGPDHDKSYVVECRISDIVLSRGQAKSKKKASQQAAQKALQTSPTILSLNKP